MEDNINNHIQTNVNIRETESNQNKNQINSLLDSLNLNLPTSTAQDNQNNQQIYNQVINQNDQKLINCEEQQNTNIIKTTQMQKQPDNDVNLQSQNNQLLKQVNDCEIKSNDYQNIRTEDSNQNQTAENKNNDTQCKLNNQNEEKNTEDLEQIKNLTSLKEYTDYSVDYTIKLSDKQEYKIEITTKALSDDKHNSISKQIPYNFYITKQQLIIKLKTNSQRGIEDLLFYCTNLFNCQVNEFTIHIVTEDSIYKGDSIFENDLVISTFIQNMNIQNHDNNLTQIYKQMAIYSIFFDHFILNYQNKMWEKDYQGDHNLYDEFEEGVIMNAQQYYKDNIQQIEVRN